MADGHGYLLFVWSPAGYTLQTREGDMPQAAFSPRKPSLVLYIGRPLKDRKLMSQLGKHSTGKGCLYVKRLSDVNESVLREMIERSVRVARGVDIVR